MLKVAPRPFSTSLFAGLNEQDSRINVLIGSKKFTEGWSSWRVSTMGLMNVGQTEGAQIIQLFGRGVRLKGYNFGLKRSAFVEEARRNKPDHINLLETLNVFGVRAQFMQQFKEYLEEEGLPPNDDRIEFTLPTFRNLGSQKLKILRLPEDLDFKRSGPKPVFGPPDTDLQGRHIALDWYPKIQSRIAPDLTATADIAPRNEGKLAPEHLAFFDWREIDRQLQEFKNERAWFNMNLPRDACRALLQDPSWYTLFIPSQELEIGRFDCVFRWQEIAVALLKKYADVFFKTKKAAWEAPRLRYEILDDNDDNFVPEYRFLIDQSATEIIAKLNEVKEAVANRQLKQIE
ncbi:MAG: DEAD/DEAH box helicase, partial [Verrucomicrobiota bacterium]